MDKCLVKIHSCQIRSIAVTADSNILFTSDFKGNVKMYNIGDCSLDLMGDYPNAHKDSILSICTSKNSKTLYTSDIDGFVKIWAIEDSQIVKGLVIRDDGGVWTMDITN